MKYLNEYREGEKVHQVYLCKYRQAAVTKNGKSYENVILQDKTGTIDAKIWEPNSQGIEDFDPFDYVEIGGEVTSFAGALQINIRRLRKAREGEYDPADYLPVSDNNMDEMYQELLRIVGSVKNPWLLELLTRLFIKDTALVQSFQNHSAAKSLHHSFVGGLLEHTISVANLCDFLARQYPLLDRDLLITAALCHDIGKTRELSEFPLNDYTEEGQFLGHIVIGSEMLHDVISEIPDFPPLLEKELKHCLLSHHGELEFGSPKKPALAEAVALNLADNTDARMEMLTEIFDAAGQKKDWVGYQRLFESNLRRTDDC